MRTKLSFFVITAILFLSVNLLYAQFNNYGLKGGIQGFGLLPETDFLNDDIKISYLGKGLLRIELIELFDLEIGAGYGLLAGDEPKKIGWETSIIPADIRFLLSPFNFKSINPYGYAGGGVMKWKVNKKPADKSHAPTEEDGYDIFIPFGIGFEVKLSDRVLLDISGGYNYTFTDDIDYFSNFDDSNDFANDGFWNAGLGIIFTRESGSSDKDKDGLTLDQEKLLGTDPENPDTDGDGLTDGAEFNIYKTDLLKADTDGDGLNDGDEVRINSTNPNLIDTDNDGISDGDEVLKYNTDPLLTDTDNDGISDFNEITKTKTDPIKADTDGDGLKDGDELNKYKTDPLKSDTDGDRISDGDEIFKYNTNPTKADTDGGSVDDNIEIERGTNPLNPEDDIILDISAPIVLDGVTFATGSADLTPESEFILKQALTTLNFYPEINIEVRGYTDNVGKASSNQRLSERRANSVRIWLINKGIDPNRITAKGYGEQNPIADNSTTEGRRKNRRIEFVKTN